MSQFMSRVGLVAAIVCVSAAVSLAQTSTQTETKAFEVIAVEGNQLVVRLPEGTRELTVPDDFRFTVNGKPLSVRELTPGMKGTGRARRSATSPLSASTRRLGCARSTRICRRSARSIP